MSLTASSANEWPTCHSLTTSMPAILNKLNNEHPYISFGQPLGRFNLTHDDIIFLSNPFQHNCCLQIQYTYRSFCGAV